MLGSKKVYKCSKDVEGKSWEIECSPELREVIVFETTDDGNKHCEIKFPTSVKFVGESVILKLFVNDELKDTLEIVIKSI